MPGLPTRAAVIGSTLVVLSACGQPVPPGKVRLDGVVDLGGARPQAGVIHFFSTAGSDSGMSRITTDGRFSVVLSPGEYSVAVVAKDGIDQMDEKGKPIFAKSLVAEKYASTATSGITVSVAKDCGPVTIAVERP